jgi:hypothetical protein
MHCHDKFFEHGVHFFLLETNIIEHNGQWLIRDFGRLWPSIRFEYMVCIFLLLGFIVILGVDDDYDVCRFSKCL